MLVVIDLCIDTFFQLFIFVFIFFEFAMYVFVRQCVNAKEYITACESGRVHGPLIGAKIYSRERKEGVVEEETSRSQDISGWFVVSPYSRPLNTFL